MQVQFQVQSTNTPENASTICCEIEDEEGVKRIAPPPTAKMVKYTGASVKVAPVEI